MTYAEKLKDPRWQKKRLSILERDNWKCLNCGNTKEELHVHHEKYFGNPWDIADDLLSTLCRTCHKNEHFTIQQPQNINSAENFIKSEPRVVFENWLIDYQGSVQLHDNLLALKKAYITLSQWINSSPDSRFIQLSKNDFSLACYYSNIILVCVNGDVYGEQKIVIRHG